MSKVKREGISTKQFHVEFRREIKERGGITEAAIHFDVSKPFIRNVLLCRELPGKKILKLMKLEHIKEISYRYRKVK